MDELEVIDGDRLWGTPTNEATPRNLFHDRTMAIQALVSKQRASTSSWLWEQPCVGKGRNV